MAKYQPQIFQWFHMIVILNNMFSNYAIISLEFITDTLCL